ncbi:serine/threonine-protein phosphatase 4 regulatory subunit 4-like isoform X2 [Trichogramma pretiosum]|uniref:serine/threonine-protein phosphatase 4 regulatory subunit 4-like isoform X2 n=1 Tax=Trichogramma pretiosum TaxID=7493 RepID=UPI0006C964B5|nr:serine/threonine-protein phosphatase 4 regulatory subunit 4-like isoform X2 [Trichogramma pretiosum]
MWPNEDIEGSAFELELKVKGSEIQKLNVIETLPQLLSEDVQLCVNHVLPKIQQLLPGAAAEIHVAASLIFRQILDQRLCSHAFFAEHLLPIVLGSLDSREPNIANAWLETTLDAIEALPLEHFKRKVLPIAQAGAQSSQSVNTRMTSCQLLGKLATRLDPASLRDEILPAVQSLCRDTNNDVRACMCLQLHLLVKGLSNEDSSKLLSLVIEMVNDEQSNVKLAAVRTVGEIVFLLPSDTIKDIILPLVKLTCEKAVKPDNPLLCVIAKEFGKFALGLEPHITAADKAWFLKYYMQLAQMQSDPAKPPNLLNDRLLDCRRSCAWNIPAMFLFASGSGAEGSGAGAAILVPTFRQLAYDSHFLVRRSIGLGFHEVVKILGAKCGLVRNELLRLLKDDREEVLEGLLEHLDESLEQLQQHQLIGSESSEMHTIELGKSLLKCEAELSLSKRWRLSVGLFSQLERIGPKYLSSDFCYSYLVPVCFKRILHSRPQPVRLAAGRTLLQLLRYNLKSQYRAEIRSQLRRELCKSSHCYVRMNYIHTMLQAAKLFSASYFKEHFCADLLSLADDPVPNVRMKLVTLLPQIKAMLRLPQDKKLLAGLEAVVAKLLNAEKCRDVNCALMEAMRHMEQIQLRADNQSMLMHKYDPEDAKKYEEEKRLEAMIDMSNPALMETLMKKPSLLAGSKRSANVSSEGGGGGGPLAVNQRASIIAGNNKANQLQQQHDSALKSASSAQPTTTRSGRPPLVRQNALRSSRDSSSDSTARATTSNNENWPRLAGQQSQSQQQQTASSNWERGQRSNSPSSAGSAYDYQPQKVQCSCYELSERPSYASRSFVPSSASSSYHSQSSIDASSSSSSQQQQQQQQQQHCSCLNGSNYLRTTNLFGSNKQQQQQHDYGRSSYLSRVSDATNWQHQLDYPSSRSGSSSFSSGKYAMAELHSHYNPHWAFSSMPEMPLVDDEFMVDAGIRIPSQLATAQASAKIPNLQDIIYRNNRLSGDRMIRRSVTAFPQSSSSSASSSSSSSRQEPSSEAKSSSATGKAFGFGAAKRFSIDYEESTKPSSSAVGAADQLGGLGSNGRSSSSTRYDESGRGSSKASSLDARSKSDKARDRRHTVNYTIKLPSPKELSKLKFKRYNEMPEFGSSGGSSGHASSAVAGAAGGNGRALRRLATLDINHNQGNLSKIPVRSLQGGSRTAPVTRTSSPIRLESDLFAKVIVSSSYGGSGGAASSSSTSSSSGAAGEAAAFVASSQDRRLRRFRSSDEEVEKLCDKF